MFDDRLVCMLQLDHISICLKEKARYETYSDKLVGSPKPGGHTRHERKQVRDAFASGNTTFVRLQDSNSYSEERLLISICTSEPIEWIDLHRDPRQRIHPIPETMSFHQLLSPYSE